MTKYSPSVAWSTIAANVVQLTRADVDNPATYQITVSAIDTQESGAGEKKEGYYFSDNIGFPYTVIATGTMTIDVEDSFRIGYCPTSGKIGYVHKSAYKGYALALPSFAFRKLHPLAASNNNKYAMSILWANDPNPRRVSFTNTAQVLISDYTADVVDMDGKTFNPEEDYGQNPKIEIWKNMGGNKYSRLSVNPTFTVDVSGNIVSVLFSGTGAPINGYYVISR